MQTKNKGFTIIEVMLIVTIIGILAAVAIPVYVNYTLRAMVSEGIVTSRPAILAVDEDFRVNGTFPSDNTQAGIHVPGYYQSRIVEKIDVLAVGAVRITYSAPEILNKTITYTATPNGGNIRWNCSSDLPATYLPSSCD